MTGGIVPRDPQAVAVLDAGEVEGLGRLLAASGYFADARQAAQASVKVLAGSELGLGPITAMTQLHIVQGRVTVGAHVLAALVRRSGADFDVVEHTDTACSIRFFRGDRVLGESSFTKKDAEAAGLWGKSGPWKQHPRNMLWARAMSNGVKWFLPEVTMGAVYTPDELDGDTPGPDVTGVAGVHMNDVAPSWRERAKDVLAMAGDLRDDVTVALTDAGITSQMLGDDTVYEQARLIAAAVVDGDDVVGSDPVISEAQRTRLHVIKNAAGWADPDYRRLLQDIAGVDSSIHLTRDHYEAVCTTLEAGPPQQTLDGEGPGDE